MKQTHLAGRTRGLRPSQLKQLERLSHRRHPDESGADLLALERLAELALELETTLHLLLDDRGSAVSSGSAHWESRIDWNTISRVGAGGDPDAGD